MRHYALYDNKNNLVAIGTGFGGTEITEVEYNTLLSEIRSKAQLVEQLYLGEITIEAVPSEWQEEIQSRVNERIALDESFKEEQIPSDEFYAMVEEVL